MNIMKKECSERGGLVERVPNDGDALVLFYIRYTAGAGRPAWLAVCLFRFMKKGA